MADKLNRRAAVVGPLQHAARRLAGIVKHRQQAGRGVRVRPELWAALGVSERQFWRVLNALPSWCGRVRVYDYEEARWFTLLMVQAVGASRCAAPGIEAEHQARLPGAPGVAAALVSFVRSVLGKLDLGGPDADTWTPARCQAAGAGLVRLSVAAVGALYGARGGRGAVECTPGASKRPPKVWTATRCGRQRVAGVRARGLVTSAASMGWGVLTVFKAVATAALGSDTIKPECQRLIKGGLVLTNQAEMDSRNSGRPEACAGPAGRAACGGPPSSQAGRGLTHASARLKRRMAWAITGRVLGRVSGSQHWGRALVAHWIRKRLGTLPEGRIVAALERGLVWAWGGYVLAKSSKRRPAPPNTLSALAHAERALGIR